MTYKTTRAIRDLQDNEFVYAAGEIYPRPGLEPTQERIEGLVTKGVIVPLEEAGGEEVHEDEMNAKEIKSKLDELGVKYKSRATKAELLALLEEAGGE